MQLGMNVPYGESWVCTQGGILYQPTLENHLGWYETCYTSSLEIAPEGEIYTNPLLRTIWAGMKRAICGVLSLLPRGKSIPTHSWEPSGLVWNMLHVESWVCPQGGHLYQPHSWEPSGLVWNMLYVESWVCPQGEILSLTVISLWSLQGHTSCRLAHHGETSDSHMDRTNSWLVHCIETTQFSVQALDRGYGRGHTTALTTPRELWPLASINSTHGILTALLLLWKNCTELDSSPWALTALCELSRVPVSFDSTQWCHQTFTSTRLWRAVTALRELSRVPVSFDRTQWCQQNLPVLASPNSTSNSCNLVYQLLSCSMESQMAELTCYFVTPIGQKYTSLQLHSRRLG